MEKAIIVPTMGYKANKEVVTRIENILKSLIEATKADIEQNRHIPTAAERARHLDDLRTRFAGQVVSIDYGPYIEHTTFEHDGTVHVQRVTK